MLSLGWVGTGHSQHRGLQILTLPEPGHQSDSDGKKWLPGTSWEVLQPRGYLEFAPHKVARNCGSQGAV